MPGPLPFASNVIKAGFRMGLGVDTDALVRLFVEFSGSTTVANLVALADVMHTAWDTRLAPVAPNQVTLEQVECTDLSSDTSPSGLFTGGSTGALTGGLSAAASVVISHEIARRYRGGHPRSYWPFGADSKLATAQAWDPTFAGDVVTAYGGFLSDIAAGFPSGISFVNYVNVSYFHLFDNHTYPSGRTKAVPRLRSTPVIDPITSFVVRLSVGSQRRRNQFVG